MTKIWSRYFLKEIFSVFFLFLGCFYGLYIVIDYTNHASVFHHQQSHFAWGTFALYYVDEFVHRSDVLVPFALMIATVRTLTKLNQTNEITALRAAGLSLSTLAKPFMYVGLLFTMLLYANEQWVIPRSMSALKQVHDKHSSLKRKDQRNLAAQHLVLQDDTTLIFQYFDSTTNLFFDAYWVRGSGDIYRIKSLDPYKETPQGQHVDHLVRTPQGQLLVDASVDELSFPEMHFNKKTLLDTLTPPEDLSLTKLWGKWPEGGKIKSDKDAQVITALHRKLASPWLCFLAVIAPIPFCVRFSRQIPVFFLYALNIFGLVFVYLILDSAQVLGKRQFFDPVLSIWGPLLLFFSVFGWRLCRLC